MNHRSNLRTKLVAAFVTTGIAVAGLGATAWADTTTTTPAPAANITAKGCKHAEQRVDRLQQVRSKLESQLDRLQKAHQIAVAHNNAKRAHKLESRIDKVTKRLEAIKDRMQKIEQRCDVTPAQASPSTAS